jgi:hypothetical protein
MNEEEKANILRTVHHHTAQNTERGTHALFFIEQYTFPRYESIWFLSGDTLKTNIIYIYTNTHIHNIIFEHPVLH